ncbi:MAG: esterase/lipase family protein [Acidimicrobiales bacterium]
MSNSNRTDAPAPWLMLLESRALFELGAISAASPLLRFAGRGDRHPVLVLPGFTADDRSTAPLRRVLRSQGYWTHGWRLGRNIGPTQRIVEGMVERLMLLHERHGRPVSIVGWSLGGIFARELARMQPEAVRQVITLGSPFRMTDQDRSTASALYERMSDLHAIDLTEVGAESDREPLTVPATAIYTKTDGVVRWWQCLEAEGPQRENIEVLGSHSGLGFNPSVVFAVSDRLAQPADDWRPFRSPLLLRRFYPRPSNWREAEATTAA